MSPSFGTAGHCLVFASSLGRASCCGASPNEGSDGNVLASFTARTSYAWVLVSVPGVEDGATYVLRHGSSEMQVTMDGSVYTSVSGGMGQGGADGPGDNRPDGTGFSPDRGQKPQITG